MRADASPGPGAAVAEASGSPRSQRGSASRPLAGTQPRTAPVAANEDVRAGNDAYASASGTLRQGPVPGVPAGQRVGWGTILLDRLTGDRMLVHVFRLMLVLALVVVGLDLRQLWLARDDAPALPADGSPYPVTAPRTSTPPPNELRTDPAELRSPMAPTLGPGGTLRLSGTIDVGAAARLAAELDARGEYVTLVEIDSPGGSVQDALAMSLALRERGLAVRVPSGALCASSCPIVLAGGAVREVSRAASVGVHQIFAAQGTVLSGTEAMASAQETTAAIGRHLDAMGIAGALWFHALETPPDELYFLTPEQMIDYGLASVLIDAAPRSERTAPSGS